MWGERSLHLCISGQSRRRVMMRARRSVKRGQWQLMQFAAATAAAVAAGPHLSPLDDVCRNAFHARETRMAS